MEVIVTVKGWKKFFTTGCRETTGITGYDEESTNVIIHKRLEEHEISIYPVKDYKIKRFINMEKSGIIDIINYEGEVLSFRFTYYRHLIRIIKYMINIIRYDGIDDFILYKLLYDYNLDDEFTWKSNEIETVSGRMMTYLIERYFELEIEKGNNPFKRIFNDEYYYSNMYFIRNGFNERIDLSEVLKELDKLCYYTYDKFRYVAEHYVNSNYYINGKEEW